MMTRLVASALVFAIVGSAGMAAQQTPGGAKADVDAQRAALEAKLAVQREEMNRRQQKTSLQVQVVLARYQGDKRISSIPFSLAANAVGPADGLGAAEVSQLRMGARVPVPALQATTPEARSITTVGPISYEEIGTNIDVKGRSVGDGTYELRISLEDKSVYATTPDSAMPGTGQGPVFRTFQFGNTLILRDGQTRQFTAATDRINGETVRVEVTLSVVK